jgi:ureidoglycolate dehydrogenase (NAD+)
MSESSPESEPRVDHRELEQFSRDVLEAAGVAAEHAELLADALVRADLRGVHTHGLARLETYVRKFEAGGFNPRPDIVVEPVSESVVLVDADDGPGQSAAVRAMDGAMALADDSGVGIGAVTNSNHFGTAAYYTERASEAGFIGISMTNVGSDVAPYGGVEALLGTNPISVSVPTDRSYPITLDMATSVVAMGKIDHAADEGESIPGHWALDEQGEPATRPDEVAALRPLGGPKGYGLAIVVDVLCGLLTGVGTSPTVGPLYDAFDEPMGLGHFVAAIDVDTFREPAAFKAAVGEYVEQLHQQDSRDGFDTVRVPGELEAMTMERNRREGVPLNEDGVRGVRRLADQYDIPAPDPL